MALMLLLVGGPVPVLAQHGSSTPNHPQAAPANEPSDPLEQANRLNAQVERLSQAGRYGEAIPLAEAALAIYREQLGDSHLNVAYSLNNLGLLYQNQGRYDEAEPLYLQALAIRRQHLGNNAVDVAISLNNLAELYRLQGRYGEAEPRYLDSLRIVREQLGERHPNVTFGLNNLGLLYQTQGRYDEAEPLYLDALAIRRQQWGNDHPAVGTSLNNLAELYRLQGRYDEAEPLYLESQAVFREQLGESHPNVAGSLNNLAALYRAQGRYDEAEPLYLDALAIRRQLGETHPTVATSLNNLAALYQIQGRDGEAEAFYQEALTIIRQQLGERHPAVALALNNLAALYRLQGRYGEAEPFLQQALEIYRQQLGDRHPAVATSLNNLAALHWSQNQPVQAITALRNAVAIEEFHLDLNLATLADDQRRDYVATLTDSTDVTFSLHLQGAIARQDAAQLALTTLLRRKGRILDAGVDSLQRLRQNLSPADQQRLDELTAARQQLATLTFNPFLNSGYADLARLEAEINQLEADLARRSAIFRAEAEPVDLAAVQAKIPADGVLVEYVRYRPFNPNTAQNPWGEPRYAVYLLFANGDIEAVDLGEATEIDAAIQSFTLRLRDFGQSPTAAARILSAQILDPIQPYLTDRAHLIISPDSQLNRIPFEALQNAAGDYLLAQFQISYLNSGRDLLKFDATAPSRQPAVIVANPDYERAGFDSAQPANDSAQGAATSDNRALSGVEGRLEQLQVGPLPGTAAEAAAIAPLLPNAIVLTEANATESALKQVQAPEILHIATHGFFLANVARPEGENFRGLGVVSSTTPTPRAAVISVENPLLRSGLALAGFNGRQSGDEDGVLTALEAAQLNLLGTQLVVLSACETGLGDIANGEGVYGLRRAFAMAGAETQLMSLWQVDDFATQSLMTRYYENLTAGMGRSEALRQVQLEMINSQSPYAHPFYWAAFITTGDWRPLE
jgi:CHAT domain-containing protein/Flp pilus assembly protein TadD